MDTELTALDHGGAVIRLERLRKQYGEMVAVDELSLTTAAGEFFTILGPSGSGKTTTLMMIAGFVSPSRGRILVDDRDISNLSPQAREIGLVFQNYALFPHLSTFDNVAFPLRVRRVRDQEIQKRVAEALQMVRLEGLGSRLPGQLSGGQQQRVALARSIVFRPRVLLLDEPLGALDKKLREHMQGEIKQLQRELAVTVVYITHDQEEALTMSDRVAVMNLGRLEQVGKPEELYERPANRFVAEFLGESNFVGGTIVKTGMSELLLRTETGLEISGQSITACREGQRASASFRPEKVQLGSDGTVSGQNSATGTVVDSVYIGEATRYRVRLRGDVDIVVREQNRTSERRRRVGDSVGVSWPCDDTAIFPES